MTATNHALTGAFIGLVVGQPLLAVPVAVASHFVCDALPHYGANMPGNALLKSKGFRDYLIVEALLCFLLVLVLAAFHPHNWLLAAICAFAAASPDLLHIRRYVAVRNGHRFMPNMVDRFASVIQWFQRPIGIIVEAIWLVAMIAVIMPFVR